ncbi:nickel-responsive transcriptional regulator NikR [Paenibacillus sp. CGMCC 1.16610]|uniref:Putative nickel-responsive regulator n=1 Tax=Paenibacillus anseongense TaxID=2682845 RepID=A0ABW9UCP4_9BACL|nr:MULTISPECIES: nickel-responsive transcriptional regulator NikR [Paenibacillus]MBA2940433.1 nickel-responsive transcriptional regulator NikR [Paenibacillus sp. CGMCC 1.16610]MVQ35610.1 nickel-responsive transcriptional regulator NikR [Paenibacillus anseongense]
MSEKETLVRFGISMPQSLIEQYDRLIAIQGYSNRSEAIRDLTRKALLTSSSMQLDETVAGTIVMVYDHHISDLPITLMELQHEYHHAIISTMHIHLNHQQCLEILVVRGKVEKLRELQQRIQVLKGVGYAELSVTHVDEHGSSHEHPHTHG